MFQYSALLTFTDKNRKYNFQNWYNKLRDIFKNNELVILIILLENIKIVVEIMNKYLIMVCTIQNIVSNLGLNLT